MSGRLKHFLLHHVEERPIEKPLMQVVANPKPYEPGDVKIICQFSNGQRIGGWVSSEKWELIQRSAQ